MLDQRHHCVWLVLDSCRFDSFEMAKTPNFDRVGTLEKRYTYASWTSPSHHCMFMGLLPHRNTPGQLSAEVYRKEYQQWAERLNLPSLDFESIVPQMCFPKWLQQQGYWTSAKVSLPVLNRNTVHGRGFHEYELMSSHCDFEKMVESLKFSNSSPTFHFFNLGETHYPYMLEELPKQSGVHGVLKGNHNEVVQGELSQEDFARFHDQQVRCVEYLDHHFASLLNKCPENTWIIITSDHGELFGESGFFGHGPMFHEKLFEVPLIEGIVV